MNNCYCYKCQNQLEEYQAGQIIPREEQCQKCKTSLHCCKMCTFYNSSSYNECREPVANRIVEKERSNFCDLFKLKSDKNSEVLQTDLLIKAKALFKN